MCIPSDNGWRKLDLKYVIDTLRLIIASAVEQDWDTSRLDFDQCKKCLIDDIDADLEDGSGGGSNLIPEVLRAILEFFGQPYVENPNGNYIVIIIFVSLSRNLY